MMTLTPRLSDRLSRQADCSESETKQVFSVPAKAMLFGEYGVLTGGPALAVTWSSFSVMLEARLLTKADVRAPNVPCGVRFSSALLGPDLVVDAQGRPVAGGSSGPQSPAAFVSRALATLIEIFGPPPSGLELNVQNAYPPRLGFGSSSALVVALYLAFLEAHCPGSVRQPTGTRGANDEVAGSDSQVLKEWPQHWPRLLRVLHAAQGKGSGYDVAVQFWAALSGHLISGPKLWLFRPGPRPSGQTGHNPNNPPTAWPALAPMVKELHCPLFWRGCGSFVESLVTAPTAHVLAGLNEVDAEPHLNRHTECAEEALQIFENTRVWDDWVHSGGALPHPLSGVVSRCLELAREQGIADHVEPLMQSTAWAHVLSEWQGRFPVFKTMGAGRGDCVWVLSARPAQERKEAGAAAVCSAGPSVIFQQGSQNLKEQNHDR